MKLSREYLIMLTMFLAILVTAAGCGSSPPGEDGDFYLNLRLAHFFPATHPAETELVQGWAREIYEATGGQIEITSYPGETLLPGAEVYDGVVSGIADMGLSVFAYTRGRFPLLEAFELPGIVYPNSRVASKVAWEGIQELNPQEVQDTRLMMVLATGPGDLFTTSPVSTLEDLQGMEIRATGLSARTLEVLGAIPVAMPQSDAYESLSRGIVQGNLSPLEVLQGWRHAEVTQYLTFTPFIYNTLFFVTMNNEVWDSIPADLQAIIEEVNERFHEEVAMGLWDRQNESALQYAVDEEGMELIYLTEEESDRWKEIIMPVQEDFLQDMEEKGLPGREALDLVVKLSERYKDTYQ